LVPSLQAIIFADAHVEADIDLYGFMRVSSKTRSIEFFIAWIQMPECSQDDLRTALHPLLSSEQRTRPVNNQLVFVCNDKYNQELVAMSGKKIPKRFFASFLRSCRCPRRLSGLRHSHP